MPWPNIGATKFYAQFGLTDKKCSIKELVFSNSWNVSALLSTVPRNNNPFIQPRTL